jgi:hypothetical protein
MIGVSLTNNLSSIDLKIHFYFEDDNIHAMNADIFNNCQRQFINTLKKADKYFDEPLLIEVTAREEGGLIDIIKIIAENPLALVIIPVFISVFFTPQFPQKLPITEETKNKLENVIAIKDAIISGTITEEEFEYIASNDKELKRLRSNFFQAAKKEETLKAIEIDTSTIVEDHFLFDKITVPYDQFDFFILPNEEEEDKKNTETDNEARIVIIAPVLVKGINANWKGYYGGMPINFKITDKKFLKQIYSHDIKFGNGTYIICKLLTTTIQKVETGKELVAREVIEVNYFGDDGNFIKPIKHRKNDFNYNGQKFLFPDESKIE